MKKLIILLGLGILISGCSLLPYNPSDTPTPAETATSGLLIATFTPIGPLEVLPTQIPTLQPYATETPLDNSTAIPEDTQTPEDTETPGYIPTSLPITQITSLSVGESFHFKNCTSPTTVTFTGEITIDPANFTEVDYRWVISGTISHIGTINRTNISTATTFTIHPYTYQLGCGSYTIGLQVLAPNLVTDKKNFTIP